MMQDTPVAQIEQVSERADGGKNVARVQVYMVISRPRLSTRTIGTIDSQLYTQLLATTCPQGSTVYSHNCLLITLSCVKSCT